MNSAEFKKALEEKGFRVVSPTQHAANVKLAAAWKQHQAEKFLQETQAFLEETFGPDWDQLPELPLEP